MEVTKTSERSEYVDGKWHFHYTDVIYRLEGMMYSSRTTQRMIPCGSLDVAPESLTDARLIPIDSYSPRFTVDMTKAPNPLPANCYIKRPRIIANDIGVAYGSVNYALLDIQACEMLKKHPHQNVATYYGCEVSSDGRVVSLCFEAYRHTLMEKFNPDEQLKRACSPRCGATAADSYISAVRSGLQHMHSLGLAHNDLNPHNIMLDDHDRAIIIDFNSCTPFGSSLADIGRTYEWYDREDKTAVSEPRHDWDALLEIEAWLHGSKEKFKFPL